MKKSAATLKNNIDADDEKCHKITHLTFREGGHQTEILELIDALKKIGYFQNFQVKDNRQFSREKEQKTPERKLKTRRKAAYRRIKKYYKSIKQYKKERLRRKLCWLLSGKYKETEIAEMLSISRRTVIRDMNKIKPYYFRLSRSYFRKLEEERIHEFNAQLKGASLKEQIAILTKAIIGLKKRREQQEYNRHQLTFYIDLDYIPYDGYPRLTLWPRYSNNITLPIYLKFVCIKNGQKHHIGTTQLSYAKKRSWW